MSEALPKGGRTKRTHVVERVMSEASPGVFKLAAVIPVVDEDVGVCLGEEGGRAGEEDIGDERFDGEVEIARGCRKRDAVVLESVGGEVGGKVLLDERDDLRTRRRSAIYFEQRTSHAHMLGRVVTVGLIVDDAFV